MVNDSFPPGLTSLGVSETPCWNSPNGSSRVFAAAEDGSWGEDHWETAIFHGIELQPCCVFSLGVQYILYIYGYIRSYFYIHVNERICLCICLCLCVCIIICACTSPCTCPCPCTCTCTCICICICISNKSDAWAWYLKM